MHSTVTVLDCVHYMEQTSSLQFISTNHVTKFSLQYYHIALHTDISIPTRPVANSKHATQPDLMFVEGVQDAGNGMCIILLSETGSFEFVLQYVGL